MVLSRFSILNRIGTSLANAVTTVNGLPRATPVFGSAFEERPPRDLYGVLWHYYTGNGLYDDIGLALAINGVTREALKPLRNPANRCVEFYVSKVWPGALPDALPLVTDNDRLLDPIRQVWTWSNWASQKQVFVRKAAALGDAFVRVAVKTAPDGGALPPEQRRVYFQLIEPWHVPSFDTDERGFLTYIRVDIPQTRRTNDDKVQQITHTEVWEKGPFSPQETEDGDIRFVSGRVRVWEHDKGDEEDVARLGDPLSDTPLSAYGIDFIPFVHCQFRDVGDQRGWGAFTHAIDKIDEANRSATRLHQQLYPSLAETWVLEGAGMVDSTGRELPPPQIQGVNNSTTADAGTLQVGDRRLIRVPGGWTMTAKVAPLPFGDALAVLNAQMLELEKDLPELIYYRLQDEASALSGRAVRFLLSSAIDRAIEARGNCEAALIRLDQMALTIAQVNEIPGFAPEDIGTYAAGDFDHSFEVRDILPADTLEDAQAEQALMDALTKKQALLDSAHPLILQEAGFAADEIKDILAEREQRRQQEQRAQQAAARAVQAAQAQAAAQQPPPPAPARQQPPQLANAQGQQG